MERLIQLLDDLDDLFAPVFAILTRVHWLRGIAVLTLMLLFASAGASWSLAVMLTLPALPLADLARRRVRRLSAVPQLPARVSLHSRY